MSKPSKSPDRHSFQKDGYIKRQTEKGETVNEDYLELFDKILNDHDHKFDDPATHKNNLEYDLLTTEWILKKVRASESYAQNLYAAMCNNEFQKRDLWPILKEETWGCSWRYAGGIIADMLEKGDYIDWYMSGMGGLATYDAEEGDAHMAKLKFVPEKTVTEEISEDLFKLGWMVVDDNDTQ